MNDPKPDLVKMADNAIRQINLPEDRVDWITIPRKHYEELRNLARAVIDQLAPPPVKVAAWLVVSNSGGVVDGYESESDARSTVIRINASPSWTNGPYRVIYVTGEEGKGPE